MIRPRPGAARRWLGFAVGLAALSAAIVAVASRSDDLDAAVRALGRAAPAWVALLLALPALNWLLTSAVLHGLTRAVGRVAPAEMTALVGAGWLLNYVPLRVGLFGRLAYHAAFNGIPVVRSLRVLGEAIAAGLVAVLALLGACALGGERGTPWIAVALAAPLLTAGLAAGLLRARARGYALAVLFRYLDVLVWSARYWVVFRVAGHTLSPAQAAALAAVVQIVMVVPFVGNGLGLREWAVGLLTGVLPAWYGADAEGLTTGVGLAADLVNRAAEVAVAIPVGLASIALLWRRVARAGRERPITEPWARTRPPGSGAAPSDRC